MIKTKILILPDGRAVSSSSIGGPIVTGQHFGGGKWYVRWTSGGHTESMSDLDSHEQAQAVAKVLIDAWSEHSGFPIQDFQSASKATAKTNDDVEQALRDLICRVCDVENPLTIDLVSVARLTESLTGFLAFRHGL